MNSLAAELRDMQQEYKSVTENVYKIKDSVGEYATVE